MSPSPGGTSPRPTRPALRELTLAVSLAMGALAPQLALAQPARAPRLADADAATQHDYRIPAGPLESALHRFARQAGVLISFDPALVRHLGSAGYEGRASVREGLLHLLAPHGLTAEPVADGWTVRVAPPPPPRDRLTDAPSTRGAPTRRLPGVTVTARRDAADAVFETPGSVAVVTREAIDRLPPRNSGDLLADVPGVFAAQSRIDPGLAVNIRGLQDFGRVNVMLDGTRQNFQQSGHGANGTVYLDPELLAGVDVAKGPSSTVGGAGMIAGLVNFRTLEADDLIAPDQRQGGRVNLTTGSNAYHFAGSVAGAKRFGEDLSLVMAVSRKSVGEFEKGRHGAVADNLDKIIHGVTSLSSQDQTSVLLKGAWRISAEQSAKLSLISLDTRYGEAPTSETAGGMRNHVRSDTLVLNHQWKPVDRPLLDLRASLYYTRTRNEAERSAGGSLDENAYALKYETATVGGTLENTARIALGPMTALLKTGGEFFQDKTRPQAQALSIGADAGTTALYTGGTPAGTRTVASAFTEATLLRGDWLELTGGLRYDWYGLQGEGRMRVGSIVNPPGVRPPVTTLYTRFSTDRHDGAFAPKLTVAVKPIEPLQLFASIGRGMRPPALTETLIWGQHTGALFPYYPNPALRAERSRSWELGANLKLEDLATRGDQLRGKIAWFDNRVRDYITLARVMSPQSTAGGGVLGPYAYVNLDDPFRSRGLELMLDYDVGVAFAKLNATRMLTDPGRGGYDPFPLGSITGFPANTLGQPGDANIWYVLPPRKSASLSGGLRLLDRRLTMGWRARHQQPSLSSSMWTAQGNEYARRSWTLHDLWVSYALSPRLQLRAAVNNLLDRNYAEMQAGSYFVGPGRTATVTVTLRY